MVGTIDEGAQSPERRAEFVKLARGVYNNHPEVTREWFTDVGAVARKRAFRDSLGKERGDLLRHAGWGVFTLGPLTMCAIQNFARKLAQALYYRHFERDSRRYSCSRLHVRVPL